MLPGGFLELHADRLAVNGDMRPALQAAHAQNVPIYAECDGLLAALLLITT